MQRNSRRIHRYSRILSLNLIILSALLLAACGPLGGDDNPTPTSETVAQPTSAVEVTEPVTLETEPASTSVAGSTPDAGVATPEGMEPEAAVATPTESDGGLTVVVGSGTPESSPDSADGLATPIGASPASAEQTNSENGSESEATGSTFTGSDGTSGATPSIDNTSGTDTESETPVATPGLGTLATEEAADEATPDGDDPFFVPDDATPIAATPATEATPQAGVSADLADMEPVAVDSCEPENVPEFSGDQNAFLTVTDVNFRTGPGADCDLIGDGPIGINIPVTVLSGPVARDGEDGFVWVQVEIAGDTGWIVTEVLEPVAS